MNKELNPKFPYRLEKAHWYLMFLYMNEILTKDEFDIAVKRLERIRECSSQHPNGVSLD